MSRWSHRPLRRGVVVVVALVMVLGACSDDGDGEGSEDTDPAAAATGDRVDVAAADLAPFADIDPRDVAGAGTPLGAGLSVPEGAVLLGAAFPDLVGGGFRALLLVTGDPVGVYDALGGQASRLGMQGAGGCLGAPAEVGCTGSYLDGSDGESLVVAVRRRVDPLAGVVSGVGLVYRPPGSEEGAVDDAGTPPTAALPDVVLPDPVPTPPPEDPALAVRSPGTLPRRVEVGSELVGLAGPCTCEGGGWSMVVRLEAVERDVIHGYARQFADLGEAPDLEVRYREDLTLLGVRIGEAPNTAEIRAFVPDDGRAYAIITVRPA